MHCYCSTHISIAALIQPIAVLIRSIAAPTRSIVVPMLGSTGSTVPKLLFLHYSCLFAESSVLSAAATIIYWPLDILKRGRQNLVLVRGASILINTVFVKCAYMIGCMPIHDNKNTGRTTHDG